MAPRQLSRLVMLALLAPGVVLVGHSVSHALGAAHGEANASDLLHSAPVWWGIAAGAAAVVVSGAVGLVRAGRLQRSPSVSLLTSLERYAGVSALLAAAQLVMFAVVEAIERHALHGPTRVFVHGALAQLMLVAVLTAIVWIIALTAERLCAAASRSWRLPGARRQQAVTAPLITPRLHPVRPVGSRAPPLPR